MLKQLVSRYWQTLLMHGIPLVGRLHLAKVCSNLYQRVTLLPAAITWRTEDQILLCDNRKRFLIPGAEFVCWLKVSSPELVFFQMSSSECKKFYFYAFFASCFIKTTSQGSCTRTFFPKIILIKIRHSNLLNQLASDREVFKYSLPNQ